MQGSCPFYLVIYFFPTEADGQEIHEPIPVDLNPEGEADLSRLPRALRSHLEAFGVPNELHTGRLMPANGQQFLHALLASTNGYVRFRSSPKRVTSSSIN